MKNTHKTALTAVAALFVLSAAVAEANPYGYGYKGTQIDYSNSFNTSNKTKTDIDNSQRIKRDYSLDYKVDNSARTRINNDTRLDLKYDYRNDNISAGQNLNQYRGYSSGINQGAFNAGSATGHSMKQKQGDTTVGSLVDETNTRTHKGHSLLSPNYSYNAGNVAKGNMNQSQIGGIQSGMQIGDVANVQSNSQAQNATSGVSSHDSVSNTASK